MSAGRGAQSATASYIVSMAHNNGMIPRKGRGKAARGMSEAAAEFVGETSAIAPIGNLPLHGATGAELAGFVPHRPARPEKSEGGKRFNLVSEYKPAGDQPTAIWDLVTAANANERDQV